MAEEQTFTDKGTFTVEGAEWGAMVQNYAREDEEHKAPRFAMVYPPDRSAVYQLQPTLLNDDGTLESYKIARIDARSKVSTIISNDEVPVEALAKLVDITREETLQGHAGYHSASPSEQRHSFAPSHRVETNGQEWGIGALTTRDSEIPIPAVTTEGAYGKELFALLPTEITADGKIAKSQIKTFRQAEWRDAREGEVPARVEQELTRFGNKEKLLGEQGKVFSQQQDARANDILSETDLDAGLAKILAEHHEKTLDKALDERDFDKAGAAAEQNRSHREAVEKLSKPKTHLERLKFEREQQVKAVENGDIDRMSR